MAFVRGKSDIQFSLVNGMVFWAEALASMVTTTGNFRVSKILKINLVKLEETIIFERYVLSNMCISLNDDSLSNFVSKLVNYLTRVCLGY